MTTITTPHPTDQERTEFAINAFKGIEVGIGTEDPLAATTKTLEARYPDHLILVQAGQFLHGYDRTAYALHTLKNYQLKLIGAAGDVHLRVGCPVGNFKQRLWSMVQKFGIPYVVALGSQKAGYTVYVSNQPGDNAAVLSAVSDEILREVITSLDQRGKVTKEAARQLLANPGTSTFKLKEWAKRLDANLLQDIISMPRDLRATWGENVRVSCARMMHSVFAYGADVDKPARLRQISADVDLIKHYLAQAPKLKKLRLPFEERVGLAVELGDLVGGLIRSKKVAS